MRLSSCKTSFQILSCSPSSRLARVSSCLCFRELSLILSLAKPPTTMSLCLTFASRRKIQLKTSRAQLERRVGSSSITHAGNIFIPANLVYGSPTVLQLKAHLHGNIPPICRLGTNQLTPGRSLISSSSESILAVQPTQLRLN